MFMIGSKGGVTYVGIKRRSYTITSWMSLRNHFLKGKKNKMKWMSLRNWKDKNILKSSCLKIKLKLIEGNTKYDKVKMKTKISKICIICSVFVFVWIKSTY